MLPFQLKGELKMIWIKINGKYKTIKEISTDTNISPKLIYARYKKGITDIKELTQPKYEMVRK